MKQQLFRVNNIKMAVNKCFPLSFIQLQITNITSVHFINKVLALFILLVPVQKLKYSVTVLLGYFVIKF